MLDFLQIFPLRIYWDKEIRRAYNEREVDKFLDINNSMKKMAQSKVKFDETEESNAPYQTGFHGDQHQPGGHRKGPHSVAKGSTKGKYYIFLKLTLLRLTDICYFFST